MPETAPVWMTQRQAADYVGIAERTVRHYIAQGRLPGHRIKGSRAVRVRREDLDALFTPIPTVES